MLGNHGRSITKAVFTPLARVLARMGVTPNMVTVAGTVASVAVAVVCIPAGVDLAGGHRPGGRDVRRFGRRNAGAYDDRRNALRCLPGFDA